MSEKNEYPWLERDAHEVAGSRRPHRIHLGVGMTAWVNDAAAAVFERGLSEPLPTMTGADAWWAIRAGKVVEWRHPEGHWTGVVAEEWEKHADSLVSVVARVAGEDPQPEPAPEARTEAEDRLAKLAGLHDRGVINREQYEAKRAEVRAQVAAEAACTNPDCRSASGTDLTCPYDDECGYPPPTASPRDLAAPADSLPEGVHAAPDGTLLAKGDAVRKLPEGWQRRLRDDACWRDDHQSADLITWYEVRPVPPEPETERVPIGLGLMGRQVAPGQTITQFNVRPSTVEACGFGIEVMLNDEVWANPGVDSDGRVAVLPLTENTEEG